jgi:hypothetical protein
MLLLSIYLRMYPAPSTSSILGLITPTSLIDWYYKSLTIATARVGALSKGAL